MLFKVIKLNNYFNLIIYCQKDILKAAKTINSTICSCYFQCQTRIQSDHYVFFTYTTQVSQQVIMPFKERSDTGSSKSGYMCKATTTINGAKQTSSVPCCWTGRGGGGIKAKPTCRSEFTAQLLSLISVLNMTVPKFSTHKPGQ